MQMQPSLESSPQRRRPRPTLNTLRSLRAATPSLAAIAASFACLPLAQAQVDEWVANSGNWSNPGNWSAGTLPGTSNLVYISNTDNINRTVTYDYTGSEVALSDLFVTNSGGGINTLAMNSTGTLLDVGAEFIGYSGAGALNQSVGTNEPGGLLIGTNSGDTGSYSLSGTGFLNAGTEVIGDEGQASFIQTAGTNQTSTEVFIGYTTGSTGVYSLSGGNLTSPTTIVGETATGTFNQSGGTFNATTLSVADGAGSTGTYSLSGSATLSGSAIEYVGNMGNGTFAQSGGANTLSGNLYLGSISGSSGQYNLSGGTLTTTTDSVGNGGSGTFIQTGGVQDTTLLNLGSGNVSALYSLSSLGVLDVTGNEELAGATFIQTGGTNICGSQLQLGSSTYLLSGGSLNTTFLDVGFAGPSTFNQSGGTLTTSTLEITRNRGNPSCAYTLSGTGVLAVSASEIVGNDASLSSFVQTGGTNSLGPGASLVVGDNVNASYTLAGGTLTAPLTTIGLNGSGSFIQTSGTFTTSTLSIDAGGTYSLQNGTLLATAGEIVGNSAIGSFTQTGGTNSLSTGASLVLGNTSGANGAYSLSSGSLSTGLLIVGDAGDGNFTQTGGTMSVTGAYAAISETAAEPGTFSISGGVANIAGNLSVGGLFNKGSFEAGGAGGLNVSGSADLAVSGVLYAAGSGKGSSPVNLSGGTLSVAGLNFVGSSSLLNWTAGTLDITGQNMEIGPQSTAFGSSLSLSSGQSLIEQVGITIEPAATLTLQGGNLTLLSDAALNNAGTFAQTSGSLTINGEFTNSGSATFGASDTWGPASVFVNLAGTATFTSPLSFTQTGPVVVVTGGTVQLPENSGVAGVAGLSMPATGIFDITNNHLLINYGSGSDPIASIAAYIKSGFNAGAWNGPGIISSTAQTLTNGFRYGVGWADGADGVVAGLTSGEIEVKYTLLGDANLDGTVNGSDFSILAANFGLGNTNWDQGNFLYTSSVNGSDFSALAANFGQGDSGADVPVSQADIDALDSFAIANGLPLPTTAAVPELASAALLLAASSGIFLPRRRR